MSNNQPQANQKNELPAQPTVTNPKAEVVKAVNPSAAKPAHAAKSSNS